MLLLDWFENLKSRCDLNSFPLPRRRSQRRRRNYCPTFQAAEVEILEQRQLLSALLVTNNHDSGAGSLRAEIAAAKNGDTITFDTSHAFATPQTITLTTGELLIKKNLTIDGTANGTVTISGGNSSRVFELSSTTKPNVTLSNLTITAGAGVFVAGSKHANDGLGGAILNEGTLTVSNCILSGSGSSTIQGGAIHNDGTLTVTGSTLMANSGSYGGAIQNYGTFTVTSSMLSGNSAGDGGGIFNGGTLTVTGSTLSGNRGWGGGIYNFGSSCPFCETSRCVDFADLLRIERGCH